MNSVKTLRYVLVMMLLLVQGLAFAQDVPTLKDARMNADLKNYEKAADIYSKLYKSDPNSTDIYGEYLALLLQTKDYKEAEKVVSKQQELHPHSSLIAIDMGNVYAAEKKDGKATEQYDNAVSFLTGDDMLTQQVGAAFSNGGNLPYAIKTYERGASMLSNTYIYSDALARLYAKSGDMDKALNTLINAVPIQVYGLENTKNTLLELLGTDAAKIQQTQKILIKRINENPDNPFFAELLTWIYTQKNDWDGALMQLEAVDERNKEDGRRLYSFAHIAEHERQYETAQKALTDIVEKGKTGNLYMSALSEKLRMGLARLDYVPAYTQEEVKVLIDSFEAFFRQFPNYIASDMACQYAMLLAQYAGDPKKAATVLEKVIAGAGMQKDLIGKAKLQLGDYDILNGKTWEASLIYSQVDKDFKQDALGEEARFRNAKLSYYHGDFKWAQLQLKVLKAATSELIANDALYLSVLITENTIDSSDTTSLKRFAYADLLLFQNRDKEAEVLVDSIAKAYPKTSLQDDILMLHARISDKRRDYTKELEYLAAILDKYKDDVLGDDAMFKTAEIYANNLNDKDKAKKYYEQLLIDYPGSTYIQTARKKLAELNSGQAMP